MKSNPIRSGLHSVCSGRLARVLPWQACPALAMVLCASLAALFVAAPARGQASAPAISTQPATASAPSSRPTTASAPASAPSTQPALNSPKSVDYKLLMPFLAAGLLLLAVWTIRRFMSPQPLRMELIPGRPNTLTPLHVLAVFLTVFLIQGLMVLAAAKASDVVQLLAIIVGQALMMVVVLLVALRTFRHGIYSGMGLNLRHWLADSGRAIIALLAVLPVVIGLLLLVNMAIDFMVGRHWIPEIRHVNDMLTILNENGPLVRLLAAVSAVVMAPLAEELFFRGLLQSMLRNYLPAWPTVIISASFFAILHFPNPQDVIPLLALGLVLGYNYERTGRLVAPILIHAMFNGVMIYTYMMS